MMQVASPRKHGTEGGEHKKLDHVPSLPADLKQFAMPVTQGYMHRFPGTTELREAGLHDEDDSESNERPRLDFSHQESNEEPGNSEFTQVAETLYDLLDEKEEEAKKLRKQLQTVYLDYDELQSALAEAKIIVSEQQEQITILRQEVALCKTNVEALKMKNFVLASSTQGHSDEMQEFINEYKEMKEKLEQLQHEQKQSREKIRELTKECDFLRNKVKEGGLALEQSASHNSSEAADSYPPVPHSRRHSSRSSRTSSLMPSLITPMKEATSEALIKQLREEKSHWEEYANKLVRNMVELNPSVMEAIQHGEDADGPQTDAEKRWYAYAMRLLADAVTTNSAKVTEFDRKLLQSMRRKKDWKECDSCATQSTEVMTRANFAQTRRRRIDKLRQFFKK